MECPDKSLDLRSADRSIPFLGLKVHNIKSKTVFADHAVDALVTGPADRLPCVLPRPSVTHLQEQLDNEAFKELRGRRFDAAQEFGGKAYPHLQVCHLQSLLRRLWLWLAEPSVRCTARLGSHRQTCLSAGNKQTPFLWVPHIA